MTPMILLFVMFFATILLGALTYMAWFSPVQYRSIIEWYATLHRGWNQEQYTWMRSKPYMVIMRAFTTIGFFVAALLTLYIFEHL